MGYFHEDVDSPHALLEIASERMPKVVPVNIFGFNRSVGTTFETVWNNGGTYTFPSSPVVLTFVSTSALDTMPVLISGLDVNYKPLAEIVTINGTTGVNTNKILSRSYLAQMLVQLLRQTEVMFTDTLKLNLEQPKTVYTQFQPITLYISLELH
jgi:hypothetical protein